MNQYMAHLYADHHDGRTRVRYASAETPQDAAERLHEKFPGWVIREMWELIPHGYYDTPPH